MSHNKVCYFKNQVCKLKWHDVDVLRISVVYFSENCRPGMF